MMKKIFFPFLFILLTVNGCKNKDIHNSFTLVGWLKNIPNQQVYVEELFFGNKPPQVLDTADIKDGKFTLTATAAHESLFRIRLQNDKQSFIFINDNADLNFVADATNSSLKTQSINSAANISLNNFMQHSDSLQNALQQKYKQIQAIKPAKNKIVDSVFITLSKSFETDSINYTKFCFQYSDTAKSPVVSLFAATMAPVPLDKLSLPIDNLKKRFPKNEGIDQAANFLKQQLSLQTQKQVQANMPNVKIEVGNIAPNITLNDVNDKPFSLEQLRGKYVLIDFWASWCGPCRAENPNVVAAFNKYKNKNFTVLGVSLDNDKKAWLKAIAADNLTWQHISDLQQWSSSVVTQYHFEAIPFNVLIDPSGKIIAKELRGDDLDTKLSEVLK